MTETILSRFKSKLPHTPMSIFSKMSLAAQKYQAINLSQGFPDFKLDDKLSSLVTHYMQKGLNQYAPMPGTIELRETIAAKYKHYYNLQIDPQEEITVTAGGTEGLFTIIATLIHPGDEVIIFEPAYDSYRPSVESFAGKVIPIELKGPDFKIDWTFVGQQITSKTKLIIINNPNNPTGNILSQQDIKQLEKLVYQKDIFILSDEVYEHLVFDNNKHISVLESQILKEKSFVVASFGKVLHATGWKMGYVIANPFLSFEFRKIHQFNVFSVNTPAQYAIADYLSDVDYYKGLSNLFQQKRDYLISELKDTAFKPISSQGTYFLLIDYSEISKRDELDFALQLTQEQKVASIPVSAFYSQPRNQHLLRLCFAKKQDTLQQAVKNLKAY